MIPTLGEIKLHMKTQHIQTGKKVGSCTYLVWRSILDLVLDLVMEDSENVSFERRFGVRMSCVGSGLEEKR